MPTSIQVSKPEKPVLTHAQKTFNRLKKKIENLQCKLKEVNAELDDCLHFHHVWILPEKNAFRGVLREFVTILYSHYTESKKFTKKERGVLKDLIADTINRIFDITAFHEADPEICKIFEELTGVNYHRSVADEFSMLKEEMYEMFNEKGLHVDLSDIEMTDDQDDIARKMFEAMREAMDNREEAIADKPKSKRQIQKEQKIHELEILQKKGLSSIYKQLAKEFHPDLELDHDAKAEKEALMKKITCAYENEDLHTLLNLEMERLNRLNHQTKTPSEDQLKIYNSILKEQIENLEKNIDMAVANPKYLSIQHLIEHNVFEGKRVLMRQKREINELSKFFQGHLKEIKSAHPEAVIRTMLKEYSDANILDIFF